MDRFEQAAAKLRERVVSCSRGCALERARKHSEDHRGLSRIAEEDLGFTKYEAHGIMDGWDQAAGVVTGAFSGSENEPGYTEGHELGEALFHEAHP